MNDKMKHKEISVTWKVLIQDQTAQNVQSDLGAILSAKGY